MPNGTDDPPRPADVPPGHDEENPYEEEDIETYPDWWRENIETFREFGMRPYRPSRFRDDVPVQAVLEEVRTEFDVEVQLRTVDPQDGGGWHVRVDGEDVREIEHVREPAGFTRYLVGSDEFRRIVARAIDRD